MSYVELGRSFGITAEGASAIIRRKVWKPVALEQVAHA
jgi:hypothetical protein